MLGYEAIINHCFVENELTVLFSWCPDVETKIENEIFSQFDITKEALLASSSHCDIQIILIFIVGVVG